MVNYKPNCLTPRNRRDTKPKKFIGIDIETDGNDNNKFICACLYSTDFHMVFYDQNELFEELKKHKYRGYKFVATNLEFDFFGSFQIFGDHLGTSERNGRIYSCTLYQTVKIVDGKLKREHPIHFYDTLNYSPFSVEKLGEIVGYPKMEHPYFFPARPKNDIEMQMLVDYCMNDAMISCLYMENIVMKWIADNGLSFNKTIASISMDDFRTNDLNEKIWLEDEKVRRIAFDGYYGGRTEVFRRGTYKDVRCYDVNSEYPSVMRNEFPDPNSYRHVQKIDMKILNKYEGVGRFKVFVPRMFLPPLPYRKSKGEKLIFPCGTFEGAYCFCEIRNAMKYGVKILDMGEGVFYTKTKKFFLGFVERHYNKRKELKKKGDPLELMEKSVLNNLYGKFGLNYVESTTFQHKSETIKDVESIIRIEPKKDFFLITRNNGTDAPAYSFPILSAYVTAYARILIYEKIKSVEDSILYMDTDSMFIQKDIPSSDELGEFKLEYRSIFLGISYIEFTGTPFE